MEKDSTDYEQVNGDDNPSSSSDDKQQQIADQTVIEDDFDILSMTLPLLPGSHLFSKNLLRDQSTKNNVITAIVGVVSAIIYSALSLPNNSNTQYQFTSL